MTPGSIYSISVISFAHPAGNMATGSSKVICLFSRYKRDNYFNVRNPSKRCQVACLTEIYDLQQSLCLEIRLSDSSVWVNGP